MLPRFFFDVFRDSHIGLYVPRVPREIHHTKLASMARKDYGLEKQKLHSTHSIPDHVLSLTGHAQKDGIFLKYT